MIRQLFIAVTPQEDPSSSTYMYVLKMAAFLAVPATTLFGAPNSLRNHDFQTERAVEGDSGLPLASCSPKPLAPLASRGSWLSVRYPCTYPQSISAKAVHFVLSLPPTNLPYVKQAFRFWEHLRCVLPKNKQTILPRR